VERTLEGRGDHLKEYLLGVEVFGRDGAYDPRIDPVVRVEARQLRFKLTEYYATEGRDDPVRILVLLCYK
jgi:serine/threonine-protein kinase